VKILVVEDDDNTRLLLHRVILKKFNCQVIEAKDGLEALSLIHSANPDLVVLDIMMPYLDGTAVLEAIRSDPDHNRLPVIISSALDERQTVLTLVKLGVSDYLLKPLRVEVIEKRVGNVLATIRSTQTNPSSSESRSSDLSHERLMIADTDPNFRAFFGSVFAGESTVIEAETGMAALKLAMDHPPTMIFMGEGLPLLNERRLVRKIREIDPDRSMRVYLCADRTVTDESLSSLFDGIMRKRFVPASFKEEFVRVVQCGKGSAEQTLDLLSHKLHDDYVTALRQTLGIMTTQEISLVADAQSPTALEVRASVAMKEETGPLEVSMELWGSKENTRALAELILGSAISFEEGAGDALAEVLNTVGGRIRSSLASRGVKVNVLIPEFESSVGDRTDGAWLHSFRFQTGNGGIFLFGIRTIPKTV